MIKKLLECIKIFIKLIIFKYFLLITLTLPVINLVYTSMTGYSVKSGRTFKKYLASNNIIVNDDIKIIRDREYDFKYVVNIKTKYGKKDVYLSDYVEYGDKGSYNFIEDIIVNPYLDDKINKNKHKYENILVNLNNFRLHNEIVYKFMYTLNIKNTMLLDNGQVIKTRKYYYFKPNEEIYLSKFVYELLDKPINIENIDLNNYLDNKLIPIILIKILNKHNKEQLVKNIYEHLAFYNNLDDIKIVFDLEE